MARNVLVVVAAVALFAALFVMGSALQAKISPAPPNVGGRSEACAMSQDFVRDRLKAPATAQFSDACQATQAAGTWSVSASVDSENGFGAMIRSDYVAEMRYNAAANTWTLTNLSINSR